MDYDVVCEQEIHFELHYHWERWLRKSGHGVCPVAAASAFNCMVWVLPNVVSLIKKESSEVQKELRRELTDILASDQQVHYDQPIGRGRRPSVDQQVNVIIETMEAMRFLKCAKQKKVVLSV